MPILPVLCSFCDSVASLSWLYPATFYGPSYVEYTCNACYKPSDYWIMRVATCKTVNQGEVSV